MSSIAAVVGDIGSGRTGGEQYDARLLKAATQSGFNVSYITWQGSWLDKLMGLPLLWRLRFLTRTTQLTWQLWRSSGDVWIDVWLAPYVQLWAKHTSQNIILMVHHLRGELENNRSLQAAERVLIQAASRILTVSESSKQQVLAYCEGDVSISIISPGFVRPQVQYLARKQEQDTVQLLFVGHITQAKGILDVLEAVTRLPEKKWFLHVVGGAAAEPDTWDKAKKWIKDNSLSAHVMMYGRVEDEALQALYQQADVFVLPSYWEGYGIVFLEAMSLALPIISTTAGAIPEVVCHEGNGLLVEAGDVQALSQALNAMITQPKQRKIWADESLALANQAVDWAEVEQRFLAWWEKGKHDVRGH